jgi:hypothetical protein
MNKHLLLALIAIPLIAGCEANGSSSTQAEGTYEDSTSTDIGPSSDSGDPNFSNVVNTAPGLVLERIVHPLALGCISIPAPPNTQIVNVSIYEETHHSAGEYDIKSSVLAGFLPLIRYRAEVVPGERIDEIEISEDLCDVMEIYPTEERELHILIAY